MITPGMWWGGYIRLKVDPENVAPVIEQLFHLRIPYMIRRSNEKAVFLLAQKHYQRWQLMRYETSKAQAENREETIEVLGAARITRILFSRLGIIMGVLCAVFLVCLCSAIVWEIRVEGGSLTDEDYIIEELSSYGVHEGSLFSSLDFGRIAASFAIDHPNISWMNINRRGVVVVVNCLFLQKQGKDQQKREDKKGANLVAQQDGVIEECEIKQGRVLVVPGQVVGKGEVLVSGIYEGAQQTYLTYAEGIIKARVHHTIEVTVPFHEIIEISSKSETVGMQIRLWGQTMLLWRAKDRTPSITETERGYLFGALRLPLSTIKEVCFSNVSEVITRNETEVIQEAYRELYARIASLLSTGELVSRKTEGYFNESGYVLVCELVSIENIAETLEFYLD